MIIVIYQDDNHHLNGRVAVPMRQGSESVAHPLILVTGAAGKTGSAVVAQLLERNWPVRAVVRRHDERSARMARAGAEIVVADMFDPDQILAAMRGAARAYYLPPFDPRMLKGAEAFATAAREVRLEAIVGLSQWLASEHHPALETRQLWQVDRLFGALPGVAHTIVNPPFFADNYLRLIGFAAHLGTLPSLTGSSRNAPPSNEDIARVAVAALIDPDRHAGHNYRPTGPDLLSTADMAVILSRVLNRKVRTLEMPMWLFLKAARMQGVPPFELSGFRYWVEDHKQRAFEFGAPNDDILRVTGRHPEDFETIAKRYAALPEARRSVGASLAAFADFMRTPLSPGYNLNRYDRQLGLPKPKVTRFAMQDAQWRAARETQIARRPLVNAPQKGVLA